MMFEELTISIVKNLDNLVSLLASWLDQHLINILAILLGAWLIRKFGAQLITNILKHTVRPDLYPTKTDRDKRIKTLESLVGAVMRFGVSIVVGILIIGEINPTYMTALVAGAGLIGVALGFGAQSLIKDFVSGIFIIIENQYRVGDLVQISGIIGTVQDVTIRTTILRDINGDVHHVPNGTITFTTNKSMGFSCINEDLTVPDDTDYQHLEKTIEEVGKQLTRNPKLKNKLIVPPYLARIEGYSSNGLLIKICGKTAAGAQLEVRSELYKLLPGAFNKAKIKINTAAPAKSLVSTKKPA